MNWTNYRRLVDYLTALPPTRFKYTRVMLDNCGCVAGHIHEMCGTKHLDIFESGEWRTIARFLESTETEAKYVFGWSDTEIERGADALSSAFTGQAGIAEALRRLNVVAQRYGGEPSAVAPSAYTPDDAAFLASVRALIMQPLVESEQ
jgi:hypothetical protein